MLLAEPTVPQPRLAGKKGEGRADGAVYFCPARASKNHAPKHRGTNCSRPSQVIRPKLQYTISGIIVTGSGAQNTNDYILVTGNGTKMPMTRF